MTTCTARIREVTPDETMKVTDWFKAAFSASTPCGKEAAWQSAEGPRCTAHAEAMVDSMMSDKTIVGIYLAKRGTQPKTREEAFKRLFVPLS